LTHELYHNLPIGAKAAFATIAKGLWFAGREHEEGRTQFPPLSRRWLDPLSSHADQDFDRALALWRPFLYQSNADAKESEPEYLRFVPEQMAVPWDPTQIQHSTHGISLPLGHMLGEGGYAKVFECVPFDVVRFVLPSQFAYAFGWGFMSQIKE
jgi:hypothetical protein